jgi:hypothetical protein
MLGPLKYYPIGILKYGNLRSKLIILSESSEIISSLLKGIKIKLILIVIWKSNN